jgi:hypothetical protein
LRFMRKTLYFLLLSFVISLCIAQTSLARKFEDLFNGKNLSGWKTNGNWVVQKEGSLLIDPLPEQTGWKRFDDYLISEKTYGDFILEMEYKCPPKGNSGLFFRIGNPQNPVDTGTEIQILDCFGKKDKSMTHHDHGGIIMLKRPSKNASKKPGEWNHLIVSCEGHHIRVGLNGVEVQNVYLDSEVDDGLPPYDLSKRPMRGHIGLQDHGVPHRVEFRNIKILEL